MRSLGVSASRRLVSSSHHIYGVSPSRHRVLNSSSGSRHRDTGSGSLSYKGCGQSASVTLAIEGPKYRSICLILAASPSRCFDQAASVVFLAILTLNRKSFSCHPRESALTLPTSLKCDAVTAFAQTIRFYVIDSLLLTFGNDNAAFAFRLRLRDAPGAILGRSSLHSHSTEWRVPPLNRSIAWFPDKLSLHR